MNGFKQRGAATLWLLAQMHWNVTFVSISLM